MKTNTIRWTAIALSLLAAAAHAAPPQTMNVQGSLTTAGGVLVPDGNYQLTFRIYNVANGGAALWSEVQVAAVSGSIFSAILGQIAPLTLPFDQPYWLGVQVAADPEMSPRIPLTSAPYALNVVDGVAVKSLNGLTGNVTLAAGANISINQAGQTLTIAGTGAVADNDWIVSGNNQYSAVTGNVGIGTPAPAHKLQVTQGDIGVGTPSSLIGAVWAYHDGSASPSVFGGDHGGYGSELELRTSAGDRHHFLEPDVDGSGGFLAVQRNATSAAFTVDGNNFGTAEPRVSVTGSTRQAVFDMGASGNTSVQLPADAIGSGEILDEPGAASNTAHGSSALTLTTSLSTIVNRSITVPAAGYVLVLGNCETEYTHTNGSTSWGIVGISAASGSLPANQDISVQLPSGAASGTYLFPTSAHGLFPVAAGTHTFYMLGRVGQAAVTMRIWDAQLTLVYLPTSYGTITPTLVDDKGDQLFNTAVSPPLTPADLAAERATSEADYRNGVEAQLAAMQAELQALRAQMARGNEK